MQDQEDSDEKAHIQMLQRKFAAKIPDKVAEIMRLLDGSRSDSAALELIESARFHTHKLRGTTNCYGFESLGKALGRLENVLTEGIEAQLSVEEILTSTKVAVAEVDQARQETLDLIQLDKLPALD